jgi:hypothetical protein
MNQQSRIERMKKGGRFNPNDPHRFVPQAGAIEMLGGREYESAACGICGASARSAVHIHMTGDKAIRDVHGPFGQ